MAQAALGTTVEVAGIMPDEVVKVTVPAGTQPGQTVSASGFGMPRQGRGGRGDLVATVAVEIPRKLTGEQRSCLERYAQLAGESVTRRKGVGERIRDAIDDIMD